MMSVTNSSIVGRLVPSEERRNSGLEEEKSAASISEFSTGCFGFGTSDEAARVGGDGSNEGRISGNVNDSRALKLENKENRVHSGLVGENQHCYSVCRLQGSSKKSSSVSVELEHKNNRRAGEAYDYILSEFDQFAAKGKDEAIGYGFKIGDMVWGKVKSHPWWPGLIYNEALASPSVRRGKHEGHVLVAFFGDSSYGWFDPEELIPFEENFAEKSRQTTARTFLNAVEEAGDELARRSSLGLACRCRNEYNFSPSSAEGYFVVDVGEPEPGIYSLGQISKAQDSFRPRDMVSFLHELALQHVNDEYCSVDFIKQKAAALALRKKFYEEFDETYAQAFGSQPSRPSRPSAPLAVDPSKAPLSGRLVIAEALGKGKIFIKAENTWGQVEKDKYLFKRRKEYIQMKSKKSSSSKVGYSRYQLLLDGQSSGIRDHHMHQGAESCFVDSQQQSENQQALIDIKPSENPGKLVEGGTKKVKFLKRSAGESTAENAIHVKKKKRKRISPETDRELWESPLVVGDSTVAVGSVSVTPVHVQLTGNNGLEDRKIDTAVDLSTSQSQQAVDFAKMELQMLVTDLRALALNPFHGVNKSCPAVIKEVFLKFRYLVYQKKVLVPPAEREAFEGNSSRLPAPALVVSPGYKTNHKIVRPSVRLDDPTKGRKKRGLSDRPEDVLKKKFAVSEGVKKNKKIDNSLDSKSKKIDYSKPSSTIEKKILHRSVEYQHGDVKDCAVRVVPPTLPKAVKHEPSKRSVQMARAASPTMLVMKFPEGAKLPSFTQLKLRFSRFGPLDQSGMRVFWTTYTCRVVYHYKIDAEAALKFAGGGNLFGIANVRCYLREVEGNGTDAEAVKPQKEDDSESAVEQIMVAKLASQAQSSGQLKSCLKKPCGDEGVGSRSARVKFVLGGEESSKSEVILNEDKKKNIGSYHPQLLHSVDSILPKFNPNCSKYSSPFQQPATANDISQQMLNLLMRCNDVISNLRSALGRMPYHQL